MFSAELCSFFNFSGCGGSSLEKKENQDNFSLKYAIQSKRKEIRKCNKKLNSISELV